MFISETENQRKHIGKTGLVYLITALFCAVFGAVYERFSHDVHSGYMIYAFLFPLAGGALPFCGMALLGCRKLPGRLAVNLYNAGIAALTVGSIFHGILQIYGTTNRLSRIYWFLGAEFAIAGILFYLVGLLQRRLRSSVFRGPKQDTGNHSLNTDT